MSFQNPNGILPEYISKLEAFVRKLALWIENVKNINTQCSDLSPRLKTNLIMNFLNKLPSFAIKKELIHYFPDVTSWAYCINPFFVDLADLRVGTGEQEEHIDIQTDEVAEIKHKE